MRFAILADDLTGAADTGAAFAAAGLRTVVLLSPDAVLSLPGVDVVVLTSESRALPPDEAAQVTRRCAMRMAEWCQRDSTLRVYKKIDSTLRGHPAIELRVLMDALETRTALVAPAFPAQGRTTVGGRQLVGGVPIERSAFGHEVRTSDLAGLLASSSADAVVVLSRADLRRGAEHVADRVTREGSVSLWIADAEDESDLAIVAAACLASPLRLICGSAGLARAIAGAEGRQRWSPVAADSWSPGASAPGEALDSWSPGALAPGGVLVVAGSRHPATAAQVDELVRRGEVVVRPEVSFLEGCDPAGAAPTVAGVADALATGRSVVLSTAGLPEVRADRVDVAARLASIVADVCRRVEVGGLVLTGGDTAAAVCAALGASQVWLTGEVLPGLAAGILRDGRRPDLAVVTKAGGFGDARALAAAVAYLGEGSV